MNAPGFPRLGPRPLRRVAGLLLLLVALRPTLAQSLVFDGQNDRLLLPGSERRLPAGAFTLEAWVRSPHWKNAWFENTILSTDDLTTKEGFAFAAGGRPGGAAQLSLVLGIHGTRQRVVSPPLLAAHRWYHVAAVVENTTVRLYVDGREVAVAEVLPGFRHGGQPLQVGNGPWQGQGMNGLLDEVRVWSRARSADDIARDRTRALRGDEPGLVVYLPLAREADGKPRNRVANGIEPDLRHHADAPWGPDFAPPGTDVGVVGVDGPDVFSAQDGPRRIQVTVLNEGTKPVDGVPLVYRLDGRVVLRDTLRQPLAAGARAVHKTRVPLDCLPGEHPEGRLEVLTALADDEWPRNDTARATYQRLGKSRRVTVFDSVLHNFGRGGVEWFQFRRVVLPADNRRFSRLLMHVSVACPKGGCDAWDRVGQVFLLKNNQRYELGRFVTPYGIACGPWTIDVTDFRSVLRGHCELQSILHTFTLDGWLLSVSFEFLEGGPNPRPFQKITPLWQTDELIYGDDRYPYQLPPVRVTPGPRTRELTFRHTVTGLGQGNTDDAGEFARKTHRLILRREGRADSTVIPHLLWRTDCAENSPCPGQKGSAFLSRAGWCPGREVQPFTASLPTRGKLTLRYAFQPYRNLLASGYNSADHTEPHFWVYSYLIEKSDSLRGFLAWTNVGVAGLQRTDGRVGVTLVNTGTTPAGRVRLRCFAGGALLAEETIDANLPPDARKVVFFEKPLALPPDPTRKLTVLADLDGDEDASDDVLTAPLP